PGDGGAGGGDAGSRDRRDDGRDVVEGRERGVAGGGEVPGGVLGLHPVVVERRRREAAQGLGMEEDEAGVEGRRRPVGGGQPVLDLGVGRLIRVPGDGGTGGGDAGSRDRRDDGRDVVEGREGEVAG